MATAHGGTSAGTPRAKRPRRAHGPTTPSPTPAAAHDLDLLRRTLLVRRFEERCVGLYSAAANRGSVRLTAEELAGGGINAEVVGLRTLRLLDDATIVGSVRRTHRAVVVDEGWRSGTEATEDDYPALDTWDGCAARLVAEDGASAQGRGG